MTEYMHACLVPLIRLDGEEEIGNICHKGQETQLEKAVLPFLAGSYLGAVAQNVLQRR